MHRFPEGTLIALCRIEDAISRLACTVLNDERTLMLAMFGRVLRASALSARLLFRLRSTRFRESLPGAVWRTSTVWRTVLLCFDVAWALLSGVLLLTLVAAPGRIINAPPLIKVVCVLLVLALYLGAFVVQGLLVRRFRTRLRTEDYQLCLSCGYRLHGLPASHVCPECGVAFTKADVRQRWNQWILN